MKPWKLANGASLLQCRFSVPIRMVGRGHGMLEWIGKGNKILVPGQDPVGHHGTARWCEARWDDFGLLGIV